MEQTRTVGTIQLGMVIALSLVAFLSLGGATHIAASSTSRVSAPHRADTIHAQVTGTLYLNLTDLAAIDERQPATVPDDSALLAVRWQGGTSAHVLVAMPDLPKGWSDPERIVNAELTVWGAMANIGAVGSEPFEVSAHPIEETWLPGLVTWNTRPKVGESTGRQGVVKDGGWHRWDVTATIKRWLADPRQAHGIALLPADGTAEGLALFTGADDVPWPLGRSPRLRLDGRPDPTPTIVPSATSDGATATATTSVGTTPTPTMAPPTATPGEPPFAAWLPWARR